MCVCNNFWLFVFTLFIKVFKFLVLFLWVIKRVFLVLIIVKFLMFKRAFILWENIKLFLFFLVKIGVWFKLIFFLGLLVVSLKRVLKFFKLFYLVFNFIILILWFCCIKVILIFMSFKFCMFFLFKWVIFFLKKYVFFKDLNVFLYFFKIVGVCFFSLFKKMFVWKINMLLLK